MLRQSLSELSSAAAADGALLLDSAERAVLAPLLSAPAEAVLLFCALLSHTSECGWFLCTERFQQASKTCIP